MMFKFCSAALLCLLLQGCQAQTPVKTLVHKDNKVTFLLDSAAAAQYIVTDEYDRFFDLILPIDMSIQTHTLYDPNNTNVADLRSQYKSYLQFDMDSFSAKESRWIAEVMQQVYETCNKVNPNIYPDTLRLIKTKGRHYGTGVYYTRGKCIIIPEDALQRRDRSAFVSTMYHELFHVYSRLNPAKRKELYALIGFRHLGLDALLFPEPLGDRVLFNPDGVDFGQVIELNLSETEKAFAIPIIYSNEAGYVTDKPSFFSYLEFNLFRVTPNEDGKWVVVTEEDGLTSTLNLAQVPDFYKQIKDNTTYVIHPDEVLADNFSFIMLDHDGDQASIKFSKEGKKLLADIEYILKQ